MLRNCLGNCENRSSSWEGSAPLLSPERKRHQLMKAAKPGPYTSVGRERSPSERNDSQPFSSEKEDAGALGMRADGLTGILSQAAANDARIFIWAVPVSAGSLAAKLHRLQWSVPFFLPDLPFWVSVFVELVRKFPRTRVWHCWCHLLSLHCLPPLPVVLSGSSSIWTVPMVTGKGALPLNNPETN